jgi:hypothetical protein
MPKGPEGRGGGGRSDGGGGDGDGGGGDGVPLAACSRRSSIGDPLQSGKHGTVLRSSQEKA